MTGYPTPVLDSATINGALSVAGLASLTSGGTLSGTFGGDPTFSGKPQISGFLANTLPSYDYATLGPAPPNALRPFISQITLAPSVDTTNIVTYDAVFVTVDGPGKANGEINTRISDLTIAAGGYLAAGGGIESRIDNSGTVDSLNSFYGFFRNTSSGAAIGNQTVFAGYLQNENAAAHAVGSFALIDMEPLAGGGSLPDYYYLIRGNEPNATLSTKGGLVVGGGLDTVPGGEALIFGTVKQTNTRIWSGGFPGTGNLGLYQSLTYSGTPTGGFGDPLGVELPFNLINIQDSVNWIPPAGYPGAVSALDIQHSYGGAGSNGGRNTLSVVSQLTGDIGDSDLNWVAIQASTMVGANVTGATSSSGKGDFFGIGVVTRVASGSYVHGLTNEIDIEPQAGSLVEFLEGLHMVYFAPGDWKPHTAGAFLRFGSVYGATLDQGITFGDPQANPHATVSTSANQSAAGVTLQFASGSLGGVSVGDLVTATDVPADTVAAVVDNTAGTVTLSQSTTAAMPSGTSVTFGTPHPGGMPISPTGAAIYTYAGTMGTFLDGSAATYATAFIKGPNGFMVDNSNRIHTDGVLAPSNGLSVFDASGAPLFAVGQLGTPVNYIVTQATGTGGAPVIGSTGADATVGLVFKTDAGAGAFQFVNTTNNPEFEVVGVASAANYLQTTPAITGSAPTLAAAGSDMNVDLNLAGKGTGAINLGITSASAAGTPANFSAAEYLAIKVNGVMKYLPLATATW